MPTGLDCQCLVPWRLGRSEESLRQIREDRLMPLRADDGQTGRNRFFPVCRQTGSNEDLNSWRFRTDRRLMSDMGILRQLTGRTALHSVISISKWNPKPRLTAGAQ
jgi:hypothetical protein